MSATLESMQAGYSCPAYDREVKRYCQTLDLKDDPELIERYRRLHSPSGIWPEIPRGIREAGILDMEIYLLGTRMFMIVETPADFDWDTAMARLSTMPRQQEWEDYVALFQACASGTTSAGKWRMMERIFSLARSPR